MTTVATAVHVAEVIVAVGILVFLGAAITIWATQERLVYQPPRGTPPDDAAERCVYRAADGQELFGFLVGDASGSPTVICFHGNADLAVLQADWAREVVRHTGARVLLAEYRGYGGATGSPTYASALVDARAAFDFAHTTLNVSPRSIVLFGHSLGSAVATELASELPADLKPRALVLQSPFTSARAMAHRFAPRPILVAWSFISRVHFDTLARVATLDVPLYVVHGALDMLVPARMGRAVYEAALRPASLLVVANAGHNDVAETGGAEYWRWMSAAVAAKGEESAARSV